jgi:adenylosuccinate synthase
MLLRKELKTIVGRPTVYVDGECLVTTPLDMLVNQGLEAARASNGAGRHGSCGLGINETVTRSELAKEYKLTVKDLYNDTTLMMKLDNIQRNYLPKRLERIGLMYEQLPLDPRSVDVLSPFLSDVAFFRDSMSLATAKILTHYPNVVFEGSQGLLLDEKSQFFPHVTRARTGLTNVAILCKECKINNIEVTYVSRCYLTRHGAGPLPYEIIGKIYPKIKDDTNVWNPHQGDLRYAPLNLDLMGHAIGKDLSEVKNLVSEANMALTCLDHLNDDSFKIILKNKEQTVDTKVAIETNKIKYLSYGPARDHVKHINGGI